MIPCVGGLSWRSVLALAPALAGVLDAGAARAQSRAERVATAGEAWLASDHTSSELLADTVAAMLDEPQVGLAWLGGQLAAAGAAPSAPRTKGVRALSTQVTLEFLRRQHKSGVVFVGQYAPLAHLQPFAGEFLFGLLLDTPEWYPLTFRVRLVPALRDLQQRRPSAARVDAILELVEDDREPQDLRRALAAMLWQWGLREPAEAVLAELVAATAEGDAEDRVLTTLQLADYYTLLRDYRAAARAHVSAQKLAEDSGVRLQPVAYYAAACVYALQGDVERGIAALERCVELHESPHLDASLRLERKLFERDPEIELLRRDERFPELLRRAFGPDDGGERGR